MCLLAMEGRTVISAFLFAATEVLSVEIDNQGTLVIIPQLPLPKTPTLPLVPFICINSFLASSQWIPHSLDSPATASYRLHYLLRAFLVEG